MFALLLQILVTVFLLVSCQHAPDTSKMNEPIESIEQSALIEHDETDYLTLTFRSDGFRPGLASEWIEVTLNPEENIIHSISYWSTANDDKIAIIVIEQEFFVDEISGYTGKIRFRTGDMYEFGMIEDRFNLLDDYGLFQEYFLELDDY